MVCWSQLVIYMAIGRVYTGSCGQTTDYGQGRPRRALRKHQIELKPELTFVRPRPLQKRDNRRLSGDMLYQRSQCRTHGEAYWVVLAMSVARTCSRILVAGDEESIGRRGPRKGHYLLAGIRTVVARQL
ncbi:hypothetical protein BKA70DRAFT_1323359 [Coprinopsis sp. MPI-PUGE-AT-0042]|nr:hypothetical protein BKA70DRAFT_1323359 [Coprinopsis sp. MPI-PUGE-AT-0042]